MPYLQPKFKSFYVLIIVTDSIQRQTQRPVESPRSLSVDVSIHVHENDSNEHGSMPWRHVMSMVIGIWLPLLLMNGQTHKH